MKVKTLFKRIPNQFQKPLFKELIGHFRRNKVLDLRRMMERLPRGSVERVLLTEVIWHVGRLNKATSAAVNLPQRLKIERSYRLRFFLSRRHFTFDGTTLTIPIFKIKTPYFLGDRFRKDKKTGTTMKLPPKTIKRIWFNADTFFIELVPASKHGRTKQLTPAVYEAKTAAWTAAQEIANADTPSVRH